MSEVQARLRAALVAIAEEDVNALYEEEIEDAIATLDDGIRPEEDAEGTVSGACAAVGRLDLLVEARALGYPWNAKTCANAASSGHLECLKYAHEHGCPWDYWTCDKAAEKGHLECLKYACAHGFPGSDPYATALNEVCIPDADKRLGVEVALMFHRANGGDISMREFLPVWKEHGELYREAHLRVARELAPTLWLQRVAPSMR